MDIISNGNKPNFFPDLLKKAKKETKEVKLAVAYSDHDYLKMVIDFCRKQKIHLSIFISSENNQKQTNLILDFLTQSESKKLKFIKNLHSKVYWFLNYGVYIGSANLNETSWNRNIECGLWFSHKEPSYFTIQSDLDIFFKNLDEKETHCLITKLEEKYKETG